MVNAWDPRRNSFCNLIDFVATGKDIPMDIDGTAAAEEEGEEPTPMEVDVEGEHHSKRHHKKDKKKKKDATISVLDELTSSDVEQEDEEIAPARSKKKDKHKKSKSKDEDAPEHNKKGKMKEHEVLAMLDGIVGSDEEDANTPAHATETTDKKKKDKKEKKKKDKKKKKKHEEEEATSGDDDFELDSDDDLSLGSVPMSGSDDEGDEEDEAHDNVPGLSTGVNKRASIAEGLKAFQKGANLPAAVSNSGEKVSSNRRNTLGAALKGFQIDVNALQDTRTDQGDSGLDNLTALNKNLPTLSIAGVKQGNAATRRQSAFDVFLQGTAAAKDKNQQPNV